MVAETARSFDALEVQAAAIMSVFNNAGYEAVAPAIIQPADVFLDVVGEALRGRTYVFTDPEGEELCLRPDITVPTCRLYIERFPKAEQRAKYAYNGPAFRYQPGGMDANHPREFRQAGIESFGETDREKSEIEIVALAIDALRTAGLKSFKMRIGDLGLFTMLLGALDMPTRWRRRLAQNFWRKEAFHAELTALCQDERPKRTNLPQEVLARLDPANPIESEGIVAEYLENASFPLIGTRTLEEITNNLLDIAADSREAALDIEAAQLIDDYVAVRASPRAAGARIRDLMSERGVNIGPALDRYIRRIDLLAQTGIDWAQAEFSAEFGRSLEYYTGFVFQIEIPVFGDGVTVAGGGRYDSLLRAVGAPRDIPGVGLAIHTERLLAAVEEGL